MGSGKVPLLEIKHLNTAYKINGHYYNAISDINLNVYDDEILALVGESGCGKSTVAKTIMGLEDNDAKSDGEIYFEGRHQNLLTVSEDKHNLLRGDKIGMIFQDSLSALNPLKKIGKQIGESLYYHTKLDEKQRYQRVIKILKEVGLPFPKEIADEFPYQLSGGMRQRVMIALAIICHPRLIIADEPTTALDVTIQAQILDLLKKIQKITHAGIILITHDLGVVAQVADRVAVMYAGQIVEVGTADQIFLNAKHPYTRSLLRSVPQRNDIGHKLYVIKGSVPSLTNLPTHGDRFAHRIPWIPESAHEKNPVMHNLGSGHYVRCTCYKKFYFPDEQKQHKKGA